MGRAASGAFRVGVAVILGLTAMGCGKPQLGADDEVFKTVDALFTAVSARDEKLLGQCEERLNAGRAAGTLPADAADYLDGIVAKARAGRWESAAQKLYDFMKAQQRVRTHDSPGKRGRGQPKPGASAPSG